MNKRIAKKISYGNNSNYYTHDQFQKARRRLREPRFTPNQITWALQDLIESRWGSMWVERNPFYQLIEAGK